MLDDIALRQYFVAGLAEDAFDATALHNGGGRWQCLGILRRWLRYALAFRMGLITGAWSYPCCQRQRPFLPPLAATPQRHSAFTGFQALDYAENGAATFFATGSRQSMPA